MGFDIGDIQLFAGIGVHYSIKSSVKHADQPFGFTAELINVQCPIQV